MSGMKTCTHCCATLTLTDFSPRSSAPDGRRNKCRACTNKHTASYKRQRRKSCIRPSAVSNFGNYRSVYGTISAPKPNAAGYCRVMIHKKAYLVHRLLAVAFSLPKNNDQTLVDHIDGNKSNNTLTNLRWVTPSQNTQYSYNSGTRKLGMESLRRIREEGTTATLDGERWSVVGCVAVSDLGRFRNRYGDTYYPPSRSDGYVRVHVDGTLQAMHRIVATAFLPTPSSDKTEVDHIDGDPTNNTFTNLRWVTRAENVQASYANSQRDRGGAHRKSKPIQGRMTNEAVWTAYPSSAAAARMLGIRGSLIRECTAQRQNVTYNSQGVAFEFRFMEEIAQENEQWIDLTADMLREALLTRSERTIQ